MFSFNSFGVLIGLICTLGQLFELTCADRFSGEYVFSGPYGDHDAYVGSYYKYIGVRLEDDDGLSWADANSFCASEFGTELATIRSDDDNTRAYQALTRVFGYASDGNDWAWFGISDIDGDSDFIWADGLGSSDSYTNWDSSPSTRGSKCGEFHPDTDSQWYDYSCDGVATAFVCNRYNYYLSTAKDGYIGISTGYSYDAATFEEAVDICTGVFGDGSVLASIQSSGENNAVSDVISVLSDLSQAAGRTLTTAWIGLTLTQDSSTNDECVIAWEDGSDLAFAEDDKWTGGCTLTYGGTFDEAAGVGTSRTTGEWTSMSDNYAKYVFMCNCDSDCQDGYGIYSQSVSDRESAVSGSSARTSGSSSESDNSSSNSDDDNNNTILILCVSLGAVALILTVIGLVFYRKRKNKEFVTNGDFVEMSENSKEKDYAPPNDNVNNVAVNVVTDDQDAKVY